MSNYWLSEFVKTKEEAPAVYQAPDTSEDPPSPEDRLNHRQKKLYEMYEELAEDYGLFDQTAGANGAHYAPASANPFKSEGLICSNCVYFKGGNACEIVSGVIEPEAICKLWIIPEDLITINR